MVRDKGCAKASQLQPNKISDFISFVDDDDDVQSVRDTRTALMEYSELENSHVSQFSGHCGMGMCSSLSLDFQHMSGWPCSCYYSNLRAIDSNSLFLLL